MTARAASVEAAIPASAAASADGLAPRARVDRFSGPQAFALLREQVEDYGWRPAGSPALRRLAVRLRALMPRGRFESVPGHPGLRNVVGSVPGRLPAVVVGAHYDVEAAPRGFVGANDGAAGTAAVVTLARALRPRAAAAQRPRAALRALRRRGGAGRLRAVRRVRPARLDGVRRASRRRDAGARAAGLHRREGGPALHARGRLGPRAVGPAAPGGTHGRGGRAVLRRGRPGRSSTTTGRFFSAASVRST